jgi:glycosyltransferase involved in cell wall biosynthesis
LKILRIIARLNVGGPARHVVWLADGLRPQGYDTMLVTGVVPPGEDDMTYFARSAGVTPHVSPEMSREVSLRDALASWKVFRLMLRERPDLVHTHTAKAGTVGRVAGLLYRWLTPTALIGKPRACRFVHTYHGHVFHSYYSPAQTKFFLTIERALARLVTDRIIVVSEQQRREISEDFNVGRPEQYAVVPLGLDLSLFSDWQRKRRHLREELSAAEDELLIGVVGRLTEIKNHAMFLRAAARLQEFNLSASEQPRIRFVIIGDGSLRGSLEEQARELGLADNVAFLGTREDPEAFYPALDVVALTSHNEGTPLTLIEAMANERPVIATAVGGVVDLLGERLADGEGYTVCERGLSVENSNLAGFAAGLNRLVRDRELRNELGRRGRKFVVQNYAKERLIKDISSLYKQLLREKAGA